MIEATRPTGRQSQDPEDASEWFTRGDAPGEDEIDSGFVVYEELSDIPRI